MRLPSAWVRTLRSRHGCFCPNPACAGPPSCCFRSLIFFWARKRKNSAASKAIGSGRPTPRPAPSSTAVLSRKTAAAAANASLASAVAHSNAVAVTMRTLMLVGVSPSLLVYAAGRARIASSELDPLSMTYTGSTVRLLLQSDTSFSQTHWNFGLLQWWRSSHRRPGFE